MMHRNGFSLVELSIVLVILGLLTGGILTGQNLIRASELRSVTTEFQTYQTATMTFRDKYFYLPGDMPNATDFWGAAAASGSCASTASTGPETCNGDGNGAIAYLTTTQEPFRFWQHLANAGLIEGSFSGTSGPGSPSYDSVPGENIPQSKISTGGFYIGTESSPISGNSVLFDGDYGTRWIFGSDGGTSNINQSAILSPEETWNIDKKMDDGLPGRGMMVPGGWDNCTDAITSADLSAEYLLSDNTIACSVIFLEDAGL